jgi:hypothetical protein
VTGSHGVIAMSKNERADIICIACGRVLGEVERKEDHLTLVQNERPVLLRVEEGRLFCTRCGGRGFVEHRLLAAS